MWVSLENFEFLSKFSFSQCIHSWALIFRSMLHDTGLVLFCDASTLCVCVEFCTLLEPLDNLNWVCMVKVTWLIVIVVKRVDEKRQKMHGYSACIAVRIFTLCWRNETHTNPNYMVLTTTSSPEKILSHGFCRPALKNWNEQISVWKQNEVNSTNCHQHSWTLIKPVPVFFPLYPFESVHQFTISISGIIQKFSPYK